MRSQPGASESPHRAPAPITQPVSARKTETMAVSGGTLRDIWRFFRRMWPAIYDLSTSESYVYASAIAFNSLLSFFAFLVLIGNILAHWAAWPDGYETVYRMMVAIAPAEARSMITALDYVTRTFGRDAGFYSTFGLIFACTGVFLPLELALNRAWGFRNVRGAFKQQIVYFPLVVICACIIVCCVGLASVLDHALERVIPGLGLRQLLFNAASILFAVPSVTLIFFLLYYWLPNGRVQARRIFISSASMALLWMLMTFAYRLLLPLLNFRSRYGNMFAVVTVITWIFISCFILLLGANLSARDILPVGRARELHPASAAPEMAVSS
ncbi:MAG: YihY/virulence factor BrkB family protein [Blastocatellia bacterium]